YLNCLQHRTERQYLGLGIQAEAFGAWIDYDPARNFQLLTSQFKSLAWLWAADRPFDFDRPKTFGWQIQQEIDLRSRRRAVEPGIGSSRSERKQILNDEAFPTWPDHRMPEQLLPIDNAQQCMDDAAVPYVNFRRTYQ